MINPGEHFSHTSGVRNHAHSPLHLGKVTSRNNSRRLIVYTTLEPSGAPIHKLDGSLGLDGGHSSIHILGHDIAPVHQTTRHVLAVARVTLCHHGGWLEGTVGDLSNGKLLMVCFLGRDNRGIRGKHEMDPWVRNQVGLKLSHINIQCSIKPQRGSEG
ncbi:hypothetical protein HKD37_04G009765 [Glycine soja]